MLTVTLTRFSFRVLWNFKCYVSGNNKLWLSSTQIASYLLEVCCDTPVTLKCNVTFIKTNREHLVIVEWFMLMLCMDRGFKPTYALVSSINYSGWCAYWLLVYYCTYQTQDTVLRQPQIPDHWQAWRQDWNSYPKQESWTYIIIYIYNVYVYSSASSYPLLNNNYFITCSM